MVNCFPQVSNYSEKLRSNSQNKSRDSSVGIGGYGLDDQGSRELFFLPPRPERL
jgi:hypothetical protein